MHEVIHVLGDIVFVGSGCLTYLLLAEFLYKRLPYRGENDWLEVAMVILSFIVSYFTAVVTEHTFYLIVRFIVRNL